MRCHIRDNITEHDIVFGGRYDHTQELALIEARLPQAGVFVDIGANCGLFSLTASRKLGQRGRVLAIEPNPAMAERLRFNVATNDFENVELAECAIGDVVGMAELKICASNLGGSSLTVEVEGPRVSVPIRTLQSVLESFGIERIDAMKVDIEGFEDRAIMPFLRVAPRSLWPRSILIETCHAHLWREGCVVALRDAGYLVEWENRNDILLSQPTSNS